MNIEVIKEKLKTQNLLDVKIKKYTLLIDEKMNEQGALFFIPLGGKELKIVLPNPNHKDFLKDEEQITYRNLLMHKQIVILK